MNRFVVKTFGIGMLNLVSVIAFVMEVYFLFDGVGEALAPIVQVTENGQREFVWKTA